MGYSWDTKGQQGNQLGCTCGMYTAGSYCVFYVSALGQVTCGLGMERWQVGAAENPPRPLPHLLLHPKLKPQSISMQASLPARILTRFSTRGSPHLPL